MIPYISCNKGLGNEKASFFLTSNAVAVNPYLLFGSSEFIWPRGYPLQLLQKREMPKIVKIDSSQVSSHEIFENKSKDTNYDLDVIQVMQNIDPDVDAIWRLQNGVDNFKWLSSKTLKESHVIIGIHPLKMAPFNAQATILSRRATTIAYLPWTVHGRVSDIWRSYIMQYLLTRGTRGAIGFIGSANVNHFRNKHNFMADYNAEIQLYEQTLSLIRYLDTRKIKNNLSCSLGEEYISLMDDLYMRGFIEKGDVQSSIIWANMMLHNSFMISDSCTTEQHNTTNNNINTNNDDINNRNSIYQSNTKDIIAVLHINAGWFENIPLWMALHSHKFLNVQIYVPKSSHCHPLSGFQIHCISSDPRGFLAYESIIHTIERLVIWKQDNEVQNVAGFLFLHEDVIWKSNINFDKSRTSIIDPLDKKTDWWWTNEEGMGLPALERYNSKHTPVRAFHGQSDFFFISFNDAIIFAIMGKQMKENSVFLEIAVPSILHSGVTNAVDQPFNLYTQWDESTRMDISNTLNHFCTIENHFDIAHPVKLSSLAGILGHLEC